MVVVLKIKEKRYVVVGHCYGLGFAIREIDYLAVGVFHVLVQPL